MSVSTHFQARSTVTIAIAILGLSVLGCLGPRAAPELPVKGDHRYHGYAVVEARLRALQARELDKLDHIYSGDAIVLDSETNSPIAVGLAAIKMHHAQLLAKCADITFDIVARKYADRGRIVSDRERARCGEVSIYDRWFKYEIDIDHFRIVRVWEEPLNGTP